MKLKILSIGLIIFLFFIGCNNQKKEEKTVKEEKPEKEVSITPYNSDIAENSIIYQINVRQFSPGGTFKEITEQIRNFKKLGIKVLRLTPIQPIGEEGKKQRLGSFFSIKNFREINSEFGTADDFKNLIKEAHKNNLYVVIDWVASETSYDHSWTKEHPDWYLKDKRGNFMSPDNKYDDDTISLNLSNNEMRKQMIEEMRFWLNEYKIDGFSIYKSSKIPEDFLKEIKEELGKEKEIILLHGSIDDDIKFNINGFEGIYAFRLYNIMNDIAMGKKNVSAIDSYMAEELQKDSTSNFKINFTSTFIEKPYEKSELERLGKSIETFAALTYALPGLPQVYNGQEEGYNKILKLYEKDSIHRNPDSKMREVYEKLGELKVTNEAFNGSKNAASYERIQTSDDRSILAFKRQKNSTEAYFIANLTKSEKEVTIPLSGKYKHFMKDKEITLDSKTKLKLSPWEYIILVQGKSK